nr:MAG TPA: nucelotide kinase [Caudoviricetes sp.]
MNINNCDILIENGRLRLIYDMPGFNFPMTLIHAYSNHELNEKAMKIFEPKEWIRYLAEQSDGKTTSQVHPLLADIYKSHQEDYMAVLNNIKDEKIEPETCDSPDYDDKLLGTVIVTATGEVDEETGHRLGRLEIGGLKEMDTDALRALANDLDIDGFDTMPRLSLIFAIHEQDIDIDDSECDYDCENCEYADLNDHDDEDKPEDSTDYEYVDGPAHYHGTECIENMRKLYGDDAVRWFCICNAYKYRFRDGSKPGVTAKQDEEKARWYENYAANMMGEQRYY